MGVSVLGTILGLMISVAIPGSGLVVAAEILALFMAGLIVSAIYGSRAGKLKKAMVKQAGLMPW